MALPPLDRPAYKKSLAFFKNKFSLKSLMASRHALLLAGGWEGHFPEVMALVLSAQLQNRGFLTRTDTALDILNDRDALDDFDVLIPCWTMGSLTPQQTENLSAAVQAGLGLAGCHGGMGDAFRGNLDYEWMVGGHFVGHPHVGPYTIRCTRPEHPIMADFPAELSYHSEQYYLLVDPGIEILAQTDYTHEGRTCAMPVAWTKAWGQGRVFYSALGHAVEEFEQFPPVLTMTLNGIVWACRHSSDL